MNDLGEWVSYIRQLKNLDLQNSLVSDLLIKQLWIAKTLFNNLTEKIETFI